MDKLGLLVVVVCGFSLVTSLTTLGIPFWRETDGGTVSRTVKLTVYSGLWQTCVREQVESSAFSCSSGDYTSGLKATQAMLIIGTGLCAAAFDVGILKCCILEDNKFIGKIIAVLAISTGVFLIIGVIVYGTDVKSDNSFKASDLYAGFGLCIIAAIAIIIAGIISFFVHKWQ